MIVPRMIICDWDEFIKFKVWLTQTKLQDEWNKAFNSTKSYIFSVVIEGLKTMDSILHKYNSEKGGVVIKFYAQIEVGEARTLK